MGRFKRICPMKAEHAEEFTDALGQVIGGAIRLADVAGDLGVPQALGLTSDEWTQRRLAGHVRLTVNERRAIVEANPEKSTRELGAALGVDHKTIVNDRHAGEDSPPSGEDSPPGRDPQQVMQVMGSSASVEWGTPQRLFDLLDAEFDFEVDVCATPELAKVDRHFTPQDDGLAQEWRGVCWMNPPYGDEIPRWIEKAHASADAGATVVCLVPARVDTGWWWDHCRHAEIRFLRGRLKFGGGDTGAPFPSALVVFGRPAQVVWWDKWPTV